LGTLAALILIAAPVRGLRPVRAARLPTANVPNPTNDTVPPFFNVVFTAPMVDSNARVAAALEISACFAMCSAANFRNRLLQVIDHRPDGQDRRDPDQPLCPRHGCRARRTKRRRTTAERESRPSARRLELADHVHRHTFGSADLRHPFAQCRDRDLAPDDDQADKHIGPVQVHQHQHEAQTRNLSATGSRKAPNDEVWLSLRAR
jgi:hypothetical protein